MKFSYNGKTRNDVVQLRNSINSGTFLILDMACLLQPECNFLHRFFRCKLPVEVVDVEVKVMSMQGMHIFKRDRTTQLIRCMPWTTKLCLHPNIVKKMKTFLEVENKMGPIIPALLSQFRPPLPETNPNIRKGDSTEKRKRATPKKRFRPATPRATAVHCPLLQTAPKPTNGASSTPVTVREDTPWPSAGKMSGNLFEERNWVLPKDYLAIEDKKEDATVAKPPLIDRNPKWESKLPARRKKSVVGDLIVPFVKLKRKMEKISSRSPYLNHKPKGPIH